MSDLAVAGVVAAGDLAVHVGERLPQVVAGVRQPQVQVVMGGQGVEQFDLGAGQPRVAEQGEPLGQVGRGLLQCGKRFRVPDVGWVGVDAVQQRAPQGRLPVEVRSDIAGDIAFPVDEQLRPLPRVGGEEAGQPSRDGIAPAHAAAPSLRLLRSGRGGWPASCTSRRCSCRR